jgi:hypothetical protein
MLTMLAPGRFRQIELASIAPELVSWNELTVKT